MRNRSLKECIGLLAIATSLVVPRAGVYNEAGGLVVIEAEHPTRRTANTDGHHWHISPAEDGVDEWGDTPAQTFLNARGDSYISAQPDSGINHASTALAPTDPFADYLVQINTAGTYRLWLRWGGFDGASDSVYGSIVELKDGTGGANADWYRYARSNSGDFAGAPPQWHGTGGLELVDAGPAGVAANWTIGTPGRYTIRLTYREDGAAVDALILQLASMADPADPGPAESATLSSYVVITANPVNVTVPAGQTATFSVEVDAAGTVTYQWQKKGPSDADFVNISGATTNSFTTEAATAALNGTQYRAVVTSGTDVQTSTAATLTADVVPPTIASVGTVDGTSIGVRFSEPVEATSAGEMTNYVVTGASVSAATVLNSTTVRLDLAAAIAGPNFTVTVSGVKDTVGNTILPNSQKTGSFPASPLLAEDVGTPAEVGSTTSTGQGEFTVVAGGADIWGNSDQFHFVHSSRTNDFDIRVKVDGIVMRDQSTKAGLMVRESTDGGSRNLHAIVMPPDARNIYETGKRNDDFGGTDGWGAGAWAPNGNKPATFPNTWVRLRRMGQTFLAYASTNGLNWELIGEHTPANPYPEVIEVGLATTSHNSGTTTVAQYSSFGDLIYPDAVITITAQPANITAAANTSATFTAAASVVGAPTNELSFQWQSSTDAGATFADISGATGASFTTPLLAVTNSNTRYRVRVFVPGKEVVSSAATLTVTADTTPPAVVSVAGSGTFNEVTVNFSEPIPAASAVAANFSLNGGVSVTGATQVDDDSVMLTTSAQTPGQQYTLTVRDVRDTANNLISPNPLTFNFQAYVVTRGLIEHRKYEGLSQNNIQGLRDYPKFQNDTPDLVTYEPRFEYPPNGGNEAGSNYGNKLLGYIIPPVSGDYVFFVNSDDPSELWLSTNDSPANIKLIAREPQWNDPRQWLATTRRDPFSPENRSDTFAGSEWPTPNVITLEAGKRYYVEVLHTEGGGGDNVGVTWRLPSDVDDPANGSPPISGSYLAVINSPEGASITITQQPQNTTIAEGTSATLTVAATGTPNAIGIQWQMAAAGGQFADLAGENNTTLITPILSQIQSGTRFRAVVSVPGASTNSAEAVVTVTSDQQPPTIVSAARTFSADTSVLVKFSEPIAAASLLPNRFAFDTGVTVTAATISPTDPTVVELTTSAIASGSTNTLTITGVTDLFGNQIAASSTVVIGFQRGVLLVVGNVTLNSGDTAIYNRLVSRGYEVESIQAAASTSDNATGKDLVITSSTVNSGDVTTKFRDVEVPVINWEQALQDDFRMTGNTDGTHRGTTGGHTNVVIVDASHPLAGGLPAGPVQVTTTANTFSWGNPRAGDTPGTEPQIAGSMVGLPERGLVYGYDKGAKMVPAAGETEFLAPERRVMLFMGDDTASLFTDAAWQIFDAAVDWAQGLTTASPRPVISYTRSGNQLTITWTNGGSLQASPAVAGPSVNWQNVDSDGSYTTTTSQPQLFYRVAR